MTAVTDEFPYYLRPKKAVFSGLICVAMYLLGLVLTTDVSGFAGQVSSRQVWTTLGRCLKQRLWPGCALPEPPASSFLGGA